LAVGSPAATLAFSVTVSNGSASATGTASTSVSPPVGAPAVSATAPAIAASGATVTLSGVATDPNVPALPLTTLWTQTSGPAVGLVNAAGPQAQFVAPVLAPGDP